MKKNEGRNYVLRALKLFSLGYQFGGGKLNPN